MKKGFSLIELMFAAAVLIVALAGLLGIYALCFDLNETTMNLTLATNAINQELEEIRNNNTLASIYSTFNNATFTVPGMSAQYGRGAIIVNNSNPNLLKVTISVSWRQRGGRIIGEDNGRGGGIALNGIRDGTEDVNANGVLDSPAKIVTLISERQNAESN